MSVIENPVMSLQCLVVDDTPSCRDLLSASLKTIGVKNVLTANNGSEAFELLTKSKTTIDVVICDIRMQNGNGMQLLHALRTGLIKSMRINATFLFVTAYPTKDAVKMASSLDANGFVIKPVMPDKLEAAILKARRTVFPPMPARYADVTVPAEITS